MGWDSLLPECALDAFGKSGIIVIYEGMITEMRGRLPR